MQKIPFDEKELVIIRELPDRIPGRTGMNREYARPISEKENYRLVYSGEHPMWLTGRSANVGFAPRCIPDNIARAFVWDGSGFDNTKGGGKDMFGVPWVYVPVVGGSLEDPNVPHLMEDANDWEKVIKFPDIDSWDWEGSRRENKEYLNTGMWNMFYLMNGAWFERLISFMGFENACMALIDEEQEDAVKALFTKTTELCSANVHFARLQGIPLSPMPPAGGKLNEEHIGRD